MTAAKVWLANGEPSPTTLKNVEKWAADNKSQASIAALLGIPRREFESRLSKNKGANELRLAWERGTAQVEQALRDRMFGVAMGEVTETYEEEDVLGEDGKPTGKKERIKVRKIYVSKGATTESIFLAKSQFGWKEGESDDKKVSNVTLVLPKARTRAEYFAMLGLPDPKAIAGGAASGLKVVGHQPAALPAPAPAKEPKR